MTEREELREAINEHKKVINNLDETAPNFFKERMGHLLDIQALETQIKIMDEDANPDGPSAA